MGKRVLTCLFAALAVAAVLRTGDAQDAPKPAPEPEKPTFKAGKFLTEGDYEHIQDALAYLNLTPEDLNYEKKHRDDRLRLKVCDRALDEPLAVPGIAEYAATEFGSRSTSTHRSTTAAMLLDKGQQRWTPTEMQADTAPIRKFYERIEEVGLDPRKEWSEEKIEEASAARKIIFQEMDDYQRKTFYGGKEVKQLHEGDGGFGTLGWDDARHVVGPVGAYQRIERLPSEEELILGSELARSTLDVGSALPGTRELSENEADPFAFGAKVDLETLLVVGCRLSTWLDTQRVVYQQLDAQENYIGNDAPKGTGITGGILGAWEGPWGKVVIGGTGPNTYEGDDFIGIIDLGGDDTYKGRVACGIGLEGRAPISFVLDLSGDDRYLGEDFTQGFGFLGVGILHDLGGGNDTYKSRFCAQGCGLCGYGELYDDGGDDTYTSDSGAQGAGVFGYGHLIDRAGNDVYRGCRYVQGFAQVMGVGVLTDGGGNDLYYAGGKYLHEPLFNDRYQSLSQGFAIGNRYGETGGGVGMLLDEGDGNDVYQADIYGQGSSYWYSLGMLVDTGGNDTYTLGQYGQGGGIHLSAGILVDLKGNDSYTNPYGVGLGGAHDWAVGWLIDREGDDLYQGNGQGQGLNFAVGILMDCAGNDSHSTNHANSIGHGHNNDISLLLDFEGTDVYGPEEVKDGQFTKRGKHAMVYDVPKGWFSGIDTSTLPTKQDPAPPRAKVQHILISWKGKNERVTLKDPERTQAQAEAMRDEVLRKARTKGADWGGLQNTHNEDSVHDAVYTVEPDSPFVKPFRELALSLGKGQIDWCESQFGYHIIKRVE